MVYKSFLPSAELCEFVRNYTIIQFNFGTSEPPPVKQRSPKPEQKIVFYLKTLPKFHDPATGSLQTPSPVSIFSHQSDQRAIRLTSDFFAFIIFLQPGMLHRMIHLPMTELLGQPANAELFFGTEVREVNDQLASAVTLSTMIAIAEQFLLKKCKQLLVKSSIDTIALHLLSDPACFSLDELARQACLCPKQFYRKFAEKIGINPKLFSRLSRFNHAYRYKVHHPTISWSSIAQEFRYTDYHHMEKEFKEFTGRTPQDWINTHLSAPERILNLR